MTCADARDTLSALVDDALAPAERAAVEAHLSTCADCRRELERLRATVALLQGMERPRAPAGFVDRVVAAARPEPWPRRLGRWLFVPLGVKLPVEAAAVALVAVAAVYVVHRTPELEEVAREGPAPAFRPASPVVPAGKDDARSAQVGSPGSGASSDAPRTPSAPPASQPQPAAPAPASDALAPKAPAGPRAPVRERSFADKGRSDAKDESGARDIEGGGGGTVSGGVAKRGQTGTEQSAAGAGGAAPPASVSSEAAQAPRALATPGPAARASGNVSELDARQKPASAVPEVRKEAKTAPVPDVSGRLAVATPDAAEQALETLVGRLGGRRLARRPDPAAPGRVLVEVEVPREALDELTVGLGKIGRWAPEREPTGSPPRVRVEVSVGD
jgi:Putative zinc-finger